MLASLRNLNVDDNPFLADEYFPKAEEEDNDQRDLTTVLSILRFFVKKNLELVKLNGEEFNRYKMESTIIVEEPGEEEKEGEQEELVVENLDEENKETPV